MGNSNKKREKKVQREEGNDDEITCSAVEHDAFAFTTL